MKRLDRYERDILSTYEKGALVSARPTKAQLGAFREAARATFIKNRRVNIRLSAVDWASHDFTDTSILAPRCRYRAGEVSFIR